MKILETNKSTNVHPAERWASIIGGGLLAVSGVRRAMSKEGVIRTLAGAALIGRGLSGSCQLYRALGLRTARSHSPISHREGVRADASVVVRQDRAEVYHFWRKLENLPRVMRHLVSVQVTDGARSHWIAKGPADKQIEWDAEIINEIPNERIGWKSLPGSDVDCAGSVHFQDGPGGQGTEIRVKLQYNPPAGLVGAYFARLLGRDPEQEIRADLQRFRRILEGGDMNPAAEEPHGWNQAREAANHKLHEVLG